MIISNILGTSKNVYSSKFLKKNKGNSKPLIYFLTQRETFLYLFFKIKAAFSPSSSPPNPRPTPPFSPPHIQSAFASLQKRGEFLRLSTSHGKSSYSETRQVLSY